MKSKNRLAGSRYIAILLGLLLAALAAPVPGHALTTSITGTVVSSDGETPLAGVHVYAQGVGGGWGTATTADDGHYEVSGLIADEYRVQFDPGQYNAANEPDFSSQYYDSATSYDQATLVQVGEGQVVEGIDATLAMAGAISGTVLASDGETPLAGVQVYAEGAGGGWASSVTGGDGTYELSGLSADDFRVRFDPSGRNGASDGPDYSAEYYDSATSYDQATLVQVDEGQVVEGIDATLAMAGAILGTVLASDGETPLAGVDVYADGGGLWISATTGADGTYEVRGLSAGTYRVRFETHGYNLQQGPDFFAEYYDSTSSYDQATLVRVDEGQVVEGIDATLAMAGAISGTVLALDGVTPLAGVQVYAHGAGGERGTAVTAADGTYEVAGLIADEYRVQFDPSSRNGEGGGPLYAAEYYNATTSYADADLVRVVEGQTVPGIDATLELAGSISGTVVGWDGAALAGVQVFTHSADGSAFATTGEDGSYTLTGLNAGDYRLQFDTNQYNQDNDPDYASQFYPQAFTFAQAEPVAVASSESVTGIDATLLQPGSISGTVRAEDGTALGGVRVYADASDSSLGGGQTTTATDGTYTITGLVPSDHTVHFDPSDLNRQAGTDYVAQTYAGVFSTRGGSPVTVRGGEVTPGIDAALGHAGSIAGVVTNAEGHPLAGVLVTADGPAGAVGSALTAENGSYTIPDLPGGDYLVSFDAIEHNQGPGAWYAHEYFDNVTDPSDATLATVTPRTQTGSIDATLDLTTVEQVGWITGKVYGPDGHTPLEGVVVGQHGAMGDGGYGATTGADGSYRISTRPGAYALRFMPDDYNESHDLDLRSEWYNDATGFDGATDVYVVAGVETHNSDVILDPLHNTAPTIDEIADVNLNELTNLTFQVTATDLEAQPITYAFAGEAPPGATLTPSGVFSWTPSEEQGPGTYEIVVAASDGSLTSTRTFTITVNEVLTPMVAGQPTIAGTAAVGNQLTADPGTWEPDTAVLTYQWYRNEDLIDGASTPIYTVQEADAGTSLTVKVTGALDGYLPTTATSAPSTVPPLAAFKPATPTIQGAAKVGSRLTVNANLKKWVPQPTTVGYQWFRACTDGAAGTPIPDATLHEYLLQPADVGCRLTVRVTGAAPGYATTHADSAATPVIKPATK